MIVYLYSFSEPMWSIEARNAAIANNYFVGAINRVGTVSYIVYTVCAVLIQFGTTNGYTINIRKMYTTL